MVVDGWYPDMNENRPRWSRRKLLRYGGVGTALAIAGCGGSDDSSDDGSNGDDEGDTAGPENGDDGNETGDDGEGGDDSDEESEGLPDNPSEAFELAGNSAEQYRNWLVPELTLDEEAIGGTKRLYQTNDYRLAAEDGWDAQLTLRDQFAAPLGIEPESIESDVLIGPITEGRPFRIIFGSFDTTVIEETLESSDFERTGSDGEYSIYDDQLVIGDDVIVEHPSYEAILQTSRGERDSIGASDDDIGLLLDLVPAGLLVTFRRRENVDVLIADSTTILDVNQDADGPSPEFTRAIRTLVFDDAASVTSERVREIVIENSSFFSEVVTLELQGRVAMAEVQA